MKKGKKKENLRVKISHISSGVLVPLGRVLSEQVRSHTRRYSGRHFFSISVTEFGKLFLHFLPKSITKTSTKIAFTHFYNFPIGLEGLLSLNSAGGAARTLQSWPTDMGLKWAEPAKRICKCWVQLIYGSRPVTSPIERSTTRFLKRVQRIYACDFLEFYFFH